MLKLWVKPLVPAIPFFSRVQEHSISLEWFMVLDLDSMPTRRWKSLPLILLPTFSRLHSPIANGRLLLISIIALLTFSRFERRKNETSINRSLAFLSFGFFERPWFLTGLRRISQYLQTCPLGCRPIR
jgi:hypothetical protein